MRFKVLVTAGAALFALTSCSEASAVATGTWCEKADGQPHLALEAGGKPSGTDGSKRLRGGWEPYGDVVTLREVATTSMTCPDVNNWLIDIGSARIDG